MATTPIASTGTTTSNVPPTLTPFVRVQQRDRHEDIPACLAILTGKSIDEVFKSMESSGLPKTGPYYGYITETIISGVLIKSNLVATVWKESKSWQDVPDVAIAMVDYDPNFETGRCILFHRVKDAAGKVLAQCVVDPYPGAVPIVTDLKHFNPCWFVGIHPTAR